MLQFPIGAYFNAACCQVRYIVETMPVMLESGTKTLSLPSELYGCPYPVNPALPPGTCAAPDLCNCNAGICFGTCKGGSCYTAGPQISCVHQSSDKPMLRTDHET